MVETRRDRQSYASVITARLEERTLVEISGVDRGVDPQGITSLKSSGISETIEKNN